MWANELRRLTRGNKPKEGGGDDERGRVGTLSTGTSLSCVCPIPYEKGDFKADGKLLFFSFFFEN